jgi:hypothetical protein
VAGHIGFEALTASWIKIRFASHASSAPTLGLRFPLTLGHAYQSKCQPLPLKDFCNELSPTQRYLVVVCVFKRAFRQYNLGPAHIFVWDQFEHH